MRVMLRVVAILMGAILLLMGGVMAVARAGTETSPSAWIAFSSPDGVFLATAKGHFVRKMASFEASESLGIRNLQWSPDGRWLLFQTHVEPVEGPYPNEIYRVRVDWREVQNLTASPQFAEEEPSWSPDGNWIAFVSDRGEKRYDLFLMRPDGSDVRPLVDRIGYVSEPVWSPDSEWIAFRGSASEGNSHIYRVRINGTGLQQLPFAFDYASDLEWSPDGEWIFLSAYSGEHEFSSIFRIRQDGSEIQAVVGEERADWSFDRLSPDGQWLTAVRAEVFMNGYHLYRLRPDGSEIQTVAPYSLGQDTFSHENSSWSADGRWIAYQGTTHGIGGYDPGIFITSLDSGEIRRLTHNDDWTPVWSPPIDTPFRWWIVIGVGLALVLAGVAPWPRIAWASRPQADHRKDRERPWSERP
jgi:Tol biopolymer transport system component